MSIVFARFPTTVFQYRTAVEVTYVDMFNHRNIVVTRNEYSPTIYNKLLFIHVHEAFQGRWTKRVTNIAAHKWAAHNARLERRGGARVEQKYVELKEQIKTRICSFRCVSSDYGRNKTPFRKYLPSHLSVNKMLTLFKQQYVGPVDLRYTFYYNVFMTSFNLGFGKPRKNVCSFCIKKRASIRNTVNVEQKRELLQSCSCTRCAPRSLIL